MAARLPTQVFVASLYMLSELLYRRMFSSSRQGAVVYAAPSPMQQPSQLCSSYDFAVSTTQCPAMTGGLTAQAAHVAGALSRSVSALVITSEDGSYMPPCALQEPMLADRQGSCSLCTAVLCTCLSVGAALRHPCLL